MKVILIRPGTNKVYAVRNSEPWTKEEDAELLWLASQEITHREIADILQREYKKIVGRLNWLRHKNRKLQTQA